MLVGATGGHRRPGEHGPNGVQVDEALAARLERDGLEPFLDAWLAQPLFAGLPPEAAVRGRAAENTVEGLAESLRQAGTGAQDPLWDRLAGSRCRCS